jgi:hypothetical protein
MTKFRILSRNDYYFAQQKVLNLIWVNMPHYDGCSIGGKYTGGIQNPSFHFQLVENYIQYTIDELKSKKPTVVQTYEF